MCIIFVVKEGGVSSRDLEGAHRSNSDGWGAAWFDGETVRWKKGLTLAEIQALAPTLPTPYTLHARLASSGGKSPKLCHPFPIRPDVPLDLTGRTDTPVLFHNGHISNWEPLVLQVAAGRGIMLPDGAWSDTRGITFAIASLGKAALPMISSTNKFVHMDPKTQVISVYGTFQQYNKDILCSNESYRSFQINGTGFQASGNEVWSGDNRGSSARNAGANFQTGGTSSDAGKRVSSATAARGAALGPDARALKLNERDLEDWLSRQSELDLGEVDAAADKLLGRA